MTSASAIVVVAVYAVVCIGYVDAGCCTDCTDDTEEACGSTGWTKVGAADFRNSDTPCPAGLVVYNDNVHGCQRESFSGPNSVNIPTSGVSYSQVCGKVLGSLYHSTDAFHPTWTGEQNIESNYLDGISVTCGPPGSRQHVFSLAAEGGNAGYCPCASNGVVTAPSFVGNDYYCETQASGASDILWDGEQCDGTEASCCTSSYMPYFYKDLGSPTTDNIELRIFTNEDFGNENVYLLAYEFYVK